MVEVVTIVDIKWQRRLNILAEIIIKNSQYNSVREYRMNNHMYFSKYLIINDDFDLIISLFLLHN